MAGRRFTGTTSGAVGGERRSVRSDEGSLSGRGRHKRNVALLLICVRPGRLSPANPGDFRLALAPGMEEA